MIAGMFEFRGLRFILHLEEHELPETLLVPNSRQERWTRGSLLYHLKTVHGNVGESRSHSVHFDWTQ